MSILISTQSYRKDVPTTYGLLLEMDEDTGDILRSIKIDTPVETSNSNGRLKPGLRGLYEYNGKIYTASWNKIFVIDKSTFEVEEEISHKWMSDLHGIFVNDDGIWVSSSLPDAVILYDWTGNPKAALWLSETFIYNPIEPIDRDTDWRYVGKEFRGFREYHANNVEVKGEYVYVTGRGENDQGRVLRFLKETFFTRDLENSDLELIIEGLYGPHDGLWHEDEYWVTETTNSSIASITTDGEVTFRKKVMENEEEKIKYDGLKDMVKTVIKGVKGKGGKKVTHWTRGLYISNSHFYVGQSTWAGELASKARVIKIDKATRKIVNAFYIDIPDYPETRIYQIIGI